MRYSSRTFISLLVIAVLLSGVVLVAPPAAPASTPPDGPPYRNQIDYYNIPSPGWNTAAATMPANMTYQGMCSVTSGTYVYVMVNTTLQRYDPAGDSWTVLTGTSNPGAWGNWAVA